MKNRRGIYHTYYWTCRGWVDYPPDPSPIESIPRSLLPPEFKFPTGNFGNRWGAKDEAGNIYPWGHHSSLPDMIVCPSSQGWQDALTEGMAYYYGNLQGASGVYSDEACGYMECYAADHGHNKQHGTWTKGLQDVYRRTLETARKNNPDFAIAIEGNADQLMQYADFGLWGMSEYCDGAPFLYTFPEAKLLRGACNPGGGWPRSLEEYARFIHLFLRMDDLGYNLNRRQFFAHRKRIKDWMYRGRFMDDVHLSINKPGVIAKWFKREDADHVGVLVNIQNEYMVRDATIKIAWPDLKMANAAFGYLLEEEKVIPVNIRADNSGATFSVPSAKASSILIPVRFPEEESLRIHTLWPQKPGEDKLVVFLLNIGSGNKEVTISYALPAGVMLKDPPGRVTISAGEVIQFEIPMTGLSALSTFSDAKVTVSDKKNLYEDSCILAPPLYNGNFETDSTGNGTPDGWRTIGHYWYTHLVQNLTLPFSLHHADGFLDEENPGEGKYSLRLNGKISLPYYWGRWRKERDKAPIQDWFFNTSHHLILNRILGTGYLLNTGRTLMSVI